MDIKITKQQNVSLQCIVCGLSSNASLCTQFLETEGGLLIAVPAPRETHQGYPNRMHGGMIAALLDETAGRAMQVLQPQIWGVTVGLELKYIKPVPLDSPIFVVGKMTNDLGRIFEGEAELYLASTGELLASAAGKFFKLPVEKIADANFLHTQWLEEKRPVPNLKNFVLPQSGLLKQI